MAKVCLVANSGGHLRQLYQLRKYWDDYSFFWVTIESEESRDILKDRSTYWGRGPTQRNPVAFGINFVIALRLFFLESPDYVVSTGAGLAPPFIYVATLFGITSIYIESISRCSSLSLSGQLVLPVVDRFLVQWPDLAERYEKAEYLGNVLEE